MRQLRDLRDIATDQQTRGLQATLVIDRDTASRLGIMPSTIDNTLYDAFGQRAGIHDLHAIEPISRGHGSGCGLSEQHGCHPESLRAFVERDPGAAERVHPF